MATKTHRNCSVGPRLKTDLEYRMHTTNIARPTMVSASHHCRYGEVRSGSSVPMITTAV